MRAVLFDLDDTLYQEEDFVRGGIRAVARYLSARHDVSEQELVQRQEELLQNDGRGHVFDSLLQELGVHDPDLVQLLVFIYRSHQPQLQPFEDTMPVIRELHRHGFRTGIVTDGMASIQWRKVRALGLDRLVDLVLCTDELGREYWKPSPLPFKVALEILQVESSHAAYVGNDPTKDFAGANELGISTVHVLRSVGTAHRDVLLPERYRAKHRAHDLAQCLSLLMTIFDRPPENLAQPDAEIDG